MLPAKAAGNLTGEIRARWSHFGETGTHKKDGAITTFTYDLADQVSTSVDSAGTTNFTHDSAGNQTLIVAPGNVRTTFTWNDENKQTRVQKTGTDFNAKYRFDGLRYEKAVGGTTTRFVFDGQNYVAETNTSGVVQFAFTVEPKTYGSLLSQRKSTTTKSLPLRCHWLDQNLVKFQPGSV